PCHGVTQNACTCGNIECKSPGKHPRTKNGFKDATLDEAKIKEEWRKSPNSNIGIPTGAASMMLVVDVDQPDGEKTLNEIIEKCGALPPTATAITGSGGKHLCFAYPSDSALTNSAGRLGPDVDTRGEGGYIVVPPSMHISGRSYSWVKELHLRDLWLAD